MKRLRPGRGVRDCDLTPKWLSSASISRPAATAPVKMSLWDRRVMRRITGSNDARFVTRTKTQLKRTANIQINQVDTCMKTWQSEASHRIWIQGHTNWDLTFWTNSLATPSLSMLLQPDKSEERVQPGSKHFVHTGTFCTDKKFYMHLVRKPIV